MNNVDENYERFTKSYKNRDFVKTGLLAFEILSFLPDHTNSISDLWKDKLSNLFQFLHETSFEFKSEDDFYEMLSTISVKIKSHPNIGWRAILT